MCGTCKWKRFENASQSNYPILFTFYWYWGFKLNIVEKITIRYIKNNLFIVLFFSEERFSKKQKLLDEFAGEFIFFLPFNIVNVFSLALDFFLFQFILYWTIHYLCLLKRRIGTILKSFSNCFRINCKNLPHFYDLQLGSVLWEFFVFLYFTCRLIIPISNEDMTKVLPKYVISFIEFPFIRDSDYNRRPSHIYIICCISVFVCIGLLMLPLFDINFHRHKMNLQFKQMRKKWIFNCSANSYDRKNIDAVCFNM